MFRLAASLLLLCSGVAFAAEIEVIDPTPQFSAARGDGICNIRLSGEILSGDAARLSQAIDGIAEPLRMGAPYWGQAGDGFTLCLNSEGGSFDEGIRLAQVLVERGVGSLVNAGDRCLSACAVAFFGGTLFNDGSYAFRAAVPGAQIGVHMPRLVLPAGVGEYRSEQVEASYSAAIESIRDLGQVLLREQGYAPGMPPALFVELVSTPPNEFYMIESVQDFNRFEIFVVAPQLQIPFDRIHMATACAALLNQEHGGLDFSALADFQPDAHDPFVMVNAGQVTDRRAARGEVVWRISDIGGGGVETNHCLFYAPQDLTTFDGSRLRVRVYWEVRQQERVFDGIATSLALPGGASLAEIPQTQGQPGKTGP